MASKMTKAVYELVADALNKARTDAFDGKDTAPADAGMMFGAVYNELAARFKANNSKFDEKKFRTAVFGS